MHARVLWLAMLVAIPSSVPDPQRQAPKQAAAADVKAVMVAVVDSVSGAPITAFTWYSSCDRIELGGLWPEHWTVSAVSGDEVVAKDDVNVQETGMFGVTLTVGGGPKT
jgi:hypothetical protein